MRIRLVRFWERVRDSYWFVPSLMMIAAVALALAMVEVDRRTAEGPMDALGWIYQGGPEGARAVLSTIAGSVMSTAGVVFSITIAVLSLASGQFGPRILRSFMSDRGSQLVLGTFLGTFLYCLLVLRTVRGGDEELVFVPAISVTTGVALGVASLAVLIYFIHHIAVSIQAPHVIASVSHDLHARIRHFFPLSESEEAAAEAPQAELPEGFEKGAVEVVAPGSGYVQAMDTHALLEAAVRHDLVLRVEHRAGGFVVRGAPLVSAWPAERVDEGTAERLREAFVLGATRTQTQDVEFSVNQLVEVAVRALSPGINDPFTAINCVDHLGSALCEAARGRLPHPRRLDGAGRVRVVLASPVTFAGMADAAFNQIRQYGAGSAAVVIRLLEAMETVAACAIEPAAVESLLHHAEMTLNAGLESLRDPSDRRDVEERYRRVLRAARARRPEIG